MSLGNWGESLLKDIAGGFFGNEYVRDYTHASKTFRTNSYANAPKLKFLFHVYFDINPDAYFVENNYGLLVKDVRLPSFTMQTHKLNQYNRKRIVQTKITYDPIDITFHDDNGNTITRLWEAYYTYYYNDGTKPGEIFQGARGSPQNPEAALGAPGTTYNDRNIYNESITGDDDWGFSGGATQGGYNEGVKVPFFKNITIFGFNQHNFIAHTLINPIITNFSHDTYSYADGGGTMENKMSIDYETVVYNEGAIDGRNPGDIVTGFGDEATYDRRLSPIAQAGSNGTILGQGGLVDAVGGTLNSLKSGDILGALRTTGLAYNTFKNTNLKEVATNELNAMLYNSAQNTPNTRNTIFSFPGTSQTPGVLGIANSPTIGALQSPPLIGEDRYAGYQNDGSSLVTKGFPVDAPFGGDFNSGTTNIT